MIYLLLTKRTTLYKTLLAVVERNHYLSPLSSYLLLNETLGRYLLTDLLYGLKLLHHIGLEGGWLTWVTVACIVLALREARPEDDNIGEHNNYNYLGCPIDFLLQCCLNDY